MLPVMELTFNIIAINITPKEKIKTRKYYGVK